MTSKLLSGLEYLLTFANGCYVVDLAELLFVSKTQNITSEYLSTCKLIFLFINA